MFLAGCGGIGSQPEEATRTIIWRTPEPTQTLVVEAPTQTPTPTEEVPTESPTPEVTPTPQAIIHVPTLTPEAVAQEAEPITRSPNALSACLSNPDRYAWRSYAVAVGFPEWSLSELEYVISKESGGDLCAINPRSGAICWIQQYPGNPAFLDPWTCMSQGYAKWLDGGQSFYAHWYNWWG